MSKKSRPAIMRIHVGGLTWIDDIDIDCGQVCLVGHAQILAVDVVLETRLLFRSAMIAPPDCHKYHPVVRLGTCSSHRNSSALSNINLFGYSKKCLQNDI